MLFIRELKIIIISNSIGAEWTKTHNYKLFSYNGQTLIILSITSGTCQMPQFAVFISRFCYSISFGFTIQTAPRVESVSVWLCES